MDIIVGMALESRFTEAASLAEAARALEAGCFDLALLDISLPDGNGLELLEHMARTRPDLPVLILSVHHEAEYARRALHLGARGYLSKNSAPEELAEALAALLQGQTYVSSALSSELDLSRADTPRPGQLSPREREVMHRLGKGEKLRDIAETMRISIKTASTYRSRVMRKLGLATTADFFRYVIEHETQFR